jgi:hypothetical protein
MAPAYTTQAFRARGISIHNVQPINFAAAQDQDHGGQQPHWPQSRNQAAPPMQPIGNCSCVWRAHGLHSPQAPAKLTGNDRTTLALGRNAMSIWQ